MSGFRNLFGRDYAEDNLRIIITRHGERADLALGPHWYSVLRRAGGRHSLVSYLAHRPDSSEWKYDPPLTIRGENQSKSTGRKLLQLGYPIDYCYASPAYRSIQTANKILESQGRKDIPINIEPGLFECSSWHFSAPVSFIPPEYLAMDRHFNIDPYYTPLYDSVDATEDEGLYYQRSQRVIDAIVKTHKNQGGTILLSGHAGSIEAISRGMLGRRARPERLQYEAGKVDYCNFAILERDAYSRQWLVQSPLTNENYYGEHEHLRSTIPLHRATSQFMATNLLRGSASFARYYPYKNDSYRYY
ncbi:unnamed protein product [Rotaria sp. Silwood1]|nr:unnamed protein product [Rotaria sp. Silwood1]CAF1165692.1 unnamed protein product [Rotaria sp. Silwood1]CAF3478340.1 unnamed protein product [Rotaria sp. Silwood1]CAF4759976.1 unnamed protein product [Rotaria sp. Silwood1]